MVPRQMLYCVLNVLRKEAKSSGLLLRRLLLHTKSQAGLEGWGLDPKKTPKRLTLL
jgi:hypothetical protein